MGYIADSTSLTTRRMYAESAIPGSPKQLWNGIAIEKLPATPAPRRGAQNEPPESQPRVHPRAPYAQLSQLQPPPRLPQESAARRDLPRSEPLPEFHADRPAAAAWA